MKKPKVQKPAPRAPRQGRARHKVELILEAAIRLLDKGGLPLLTTNAVAELAGVSIGTLYQYFPNKEAILAALTEREGEELSHRVLAVLQDASTMPTEERIGRIASGDWPIRRHITVIGKYEANSSKSNSRFGTHSLSRSDITSRMMCRFLFACRGVNEGASMPRKRLCRSPAMASM